MSGSSVMRRLSLAHLDSSKNSGSSSKEEGGGAVLILPGTDMMEFLNKAFLVAVSCALMGSAVGMVSVGDSSLFGHMYDLYLNAVPTINLRIAWMIVKVDVSDSGPVWSIESFRHQIAKW
jgi:hypothetical protein